MATSNRFDSFSSLYTVESLISDGRPDPRRRPSADLLRRAALVAPAANFDSVETAHGVMALAIATRCPDETEKVESPIYTQVRFDLLFERGLVKDTK